MRRITVRTRVSGARIAVALFVLTATIVFAVPPSAQAESGVTSFSFVSAPGDFVGNGQTKTYTNANATISVGGTAGYLTFAVQQGLTTSWTVNLAAPPGSQLSPGSYSDAERALSMTPGHPGLDVNSGRGCNNLFGNFVIKTISADTYGTVNRLDASFTQHCESPDAPPL